MENRKIRELYARWRFNADLMTCNECGYSVIATRMHETAHHAAGCPHEGERNPWLQLEEILHALKVADEAVQPVASKFMPLMGTPLAIRFDALDSTQANVNHGGQTLERLADRGGLSLAEAAAVKESRKFEAMTDALALHVLSTPNAELRGRPLADGPA